MANTDTPMGLIPIGNISSGDYDGKINPYYIPSGYGTALFIGDPVVITGTSNTALVTLPGVGSFPAGTLPEINKATAAGENYTSGIITGFAALPLSLENNYSPASTEGIAFVLDDPNALFMIQEDDGDGTVLDATDVGLNADYVHGTGSTTNGQSATELDRSTAATTATLQMKIMRLVNREDNALGASAIWVVKINLHTARYTTGI